MLRVALPFQMATKILFRNWIGLLYLCFGTGSGHQLRNSPERTSRYSELRFPHELRVTNKLLFIHDGHRTEKPFCMDSEKLRKNGSASRPQTKGREVALASTPDKPQLRLRRVASARNLSRTIS